MIMTQIKKLACSSQKASLENLLEWPVDFMFFFFWKKRKSYWFVATWVRVNADRRFTFLGELSL